ncbi:cell growth regulator with EF hand domain protein 1 isoform X2 [Fukomys damarensis]|uniref:Cell growth regulator with EF hand domain protein 1 n=2 Tax=Fukomys damarensis TaxID=885580 RepID=A0A091DKM3_FUKDA|nr:cell growth regulator with EF hand domain protein 1 isoform X2 [Fukomys damarensis]XP_010603087.1 cell growth regulator with EF hand domain protein 1 isoform X2 [Fukomys damarensis]KFO23351.1 Cell growth regulator with EF hand domain protein 1 [Fukomys damarensis]
MSPWTFQVLMLPLLLLPTLGRAAPKDGTMRQDLEVQPQPLPNPFHPGPEQLRVLQNHLKGLERMEEDPEHMNREQVLLYLFALHDYDQSGQLDGLELLSMLTAALAHGVTNFPANPVILVVDKVLETQDLDGDGLLSPAELINFPEEALRDTEHRESLIAAPQKTQTVREQPQLAKNPLRQETQGAVEPREEAGDQEEARRASLEPVQEAGDQSGAKGDTPGPEEGDRRQVENEGEAPGPRGDAGGQAEARDSGAEAKELPEETLEPRNTPHELEAHSIQLENVEM